MHSAYELQQKNMTQYSNNEWRQKWPIMLCSENNIWPYILSPFWLSNSFSLPGILATFSGLFGKRFGVFFSKRRWQRWSRGLSASDRYRGQQARTPSPVRPTQPSEPQIREHVPSTFRRMPSRTRQSGRDGAAKAGGARVALIIRRPQGRNYIFGSDFTAPRIFGAAQDGTLVLSSSPSVYCA